jgi:cytidine deaminase
LAEPAVFDSLISAARTVRENAYAPYSNFKVGAALRGKSGAVYLGVNVENVAYPEGTCAEAGALAAMVAAGETEFVAAVVIADCPTPVTPCGGCRQKLVEFGKPDAQVLMTTLEGQQMQMTVGDLLPGKFEKSHMDRSK